jgi:hypothetical protein
LLWSCSAIVSKIYRRILAVFRADAILIAAWGKFPQVEKNVRF